MKTTTANDTPQTVEELTAVNKKLKKQLRITGVALMVVSLVLLISNYS